MTGDCVSVQHVWRMGVGVGCELRFLKSPPVLLSPKVYKPVNLSLLLRNSYVASKPSPGTLSITSPFPKQPPNPEYGFKRPP